MGSGINVGSVSIGVGVGFRVSVGVLVFFAAGGVAGIVRLAFRFEGSAAGVGFLSLGLMNRFSSTQYHPVVSPVLEAW